MTAARLAQANQLATDQTNARILRHLVARRAGHLVVVQEDLPVHMRQLEQARLLSDYELFVDQFL